MNIRSTEIIVPPAKHVPIPPQPLPIISYPGIVVELDTTLSPQTSRRHTEQDSVIWGIAHANKLDEKRVIHSNLDGDVHHSNYLTYLEVCWANHLTPVLTPDIVWFTLLNELTGIVRENAEAVRHLFTSSKDKQMIMVDSIDGSYILPLQYVIDALRVKVPSGVDRYIPAFTTTTPAAQLAHYAAFCDMVSPYYDYGMMLCGFPSIIVKGTTADWVRAVGAWDLLPAELKALDARFHDRVLDLLTRMSVAFLQQDTAFWRTIFKAERCGSGGQTNVSGWFTELYRKTPQGPRYAGNYPATAAKVDYTVFPEKRTFSMFQGLFSSSLGNDYVLTPDFRTLVFETTK